MWVDILFGCYLITLILVVIYLGLNYHRIQAKTSVHPQVIVFLVPFFINVQNVFWQYVLANFVFTSVNPFLTTLLPCLIMFFLARWLKSIRIIGLTGGIACGKSTLVKMMSQNLNLLIIDCDYINRQLSEQGHKGYHLIIQMLGPKHEEFINYLTKEIDRQKLSNFVFANPQFRRELTMKMGKLILWEIIKQIFWSAVDKKKLILIDAPILFETKVLEHICFPIIVVGCKEETQVKRLMSRSGFTEEEAISRVKSQMSLEKKKSKAHIYVNNEGSCEEMLTSTLSRLNKFLTLKN